MAKKKATTKKRVTLRPLVSPARVVVSVAGLGRRVRHLTLPAGTTVEELIKAEGLEDLQVRVNRKVVPGSTRLRQGDVVVVVPNVIVGAVGRYAHLDLEKHRKTMSDQDYNFFVNFVGADALGFKQEDLGIV